MVSEPMSDAESAVEVAKVTTSSYALVVQLVMAEKSMLFCF